MEAVAAGATGYLQKYSGKEKLLRTRSATLHRASTALPADVMKTSVRWNPSRGAVESGHTELRRLTAREQGDTHAVCARPVVR